MPSSKYDRTGHRHYFSRKYDDKDDKDDKKVVNKQPRIDFRHEIKWPEKSDANK